MYCTQVQGCVVVGQTSRTTTALRSTNIPCYSPYHRLRPKLNIQVSSYTTLHSLPSEYLELCHSVNKPLLRTIGPGVLDEFHGWTD